MLFRSGIQAVAPSAQGDLSENKLFEKVLKVLSVLRRQGTPTGVCEKNVPPEKNKLEKISLKSAKSGAGSELLLLGCSAKA